MKELVADTQAIRHLIMKHAHDCGVSCHIGGALSMVDILALLYGHEMNYCSLKPDDPARDFLILSKGHTSLGLYATLHHYGIITKEELQTFQQNGTKLQAHPVQNISLGIESSNGSLGQGLSYGIGIAIGLQKRLAKNRVFVILGDGECNEGSVWEAAQLAPELRLDNLVAIVDVNGLRNDGPTTYREEEMALKWSSFGWNTIAVDGHCLDSLDKAFAAASSHQEEPTVLLASTIKGKGVSFMEGDNNWHHNRVTGKIFERWLEETS